MSSKVYTKTDADTGSMVITGSGQLTGFSWKPNASTDTLVLYDATAATGGKEIFAIVGAGASELPNIQFSTGVFRVQTGSGSISCFYVAQ